jgi:hypothetical protein
MRSRTLFVFAPRLAQTMQPPRVMATPRTTRASSGAPSKSTRAPRYQDIAALRSQLPRYWWAEVSRVRALIDADVETGGRAAQLFEFVAEALADEGELQHAVALCAASRRLSAIANAQSAAI